MSGTAFGRYDPFDSCGSPDATHPSHSMTSSGPLHPITPSRPVTPAGSSSPSTALDPMNRRGTRGNGPGPLNSQRAGAPYGRSCDAAGARGAPREAARGPYAAREAQGHPGGEPGEGRRRAEASGPGAKACQEPGNGDDIGVADAAPADTQAAPAGRDAAPAGTGGAAAAAEGPPTGMAGAPLGGPGGADAGDADADDGADHHAYGSEAHTDSAFGGGMGDGHGRSHPTGGFGGEDDLRRLLQSRAGTLEPAPDALDQLRRAVPARRQRRRHVVLGAAAALLLGGTSIPAMVHVVNLNDSSEERAANAGSNQRAQGLSGGTHGEGTEQAGPQPTERGGETPGAGKPEGTGKAKGKNGAGPGAGAGTPAPDETMDVTSPACGRNQLGKGSSTVGAADSTGRIYGTFRVVNTSGAACSVEGGGTVGLVAQGSTNPDHIHVVDHTSGDEATGLPDPATTPDQLVLKPGEAYEVKFAWIPQSGGGATGCVNPGPSPTPDPSKDPGQSPDAGATATGDGGGQAGGDEGAGGGAASGGIVLSHTPEAGEPAAADAKITDACAGTVYRTEALAAP
ncbi:hypothetical protein [Streptomyces sp. NPDC054786]